MWWSVHRQTIERDDLRRGELVGEAATHSAISTVSFDGDNEDGPMIAQPRRSFFRRTWKLSPRSKGRGFFRTGLGMHKTIIVTAVALLMLGVLGATLQIIVEYAMAG
jgi:hypothetical protein